MGRLKAGVASVVITPPVGIPMSGFAARPSDAVAIYDDLHAKALVLNDGRVYLALVTLDLIGLDDDLVADIRQQVGEQTGIPGHQLLLNASHTHSGPGTMTLRGIGERDPTYCNLVCRQIAGAVRMAWERLSEARIGFGREPVQIGINRREQRTTGIHIGTNPAGPVAAYTDLIRVDRAEGTPLALLFSHAVHAVVLGAANLALSADYPGYAQRFVEMVLPGMVGLFAQGCAGDINPNPANGTSFAVVQKLGTILGAAAVKGHAPIDTVDEVSLGAAQTTLQLPLIIPTVEQAQAHLEEQRRRYSEAVADAAMTPYRLRAFQGQVEWAEDYLQVAHHGQPQSRSFSIQVLRLTEEVAVVAWPAEMFVAYQLALNSESPFAHTMAFAYSNGCSGYIPTADAYPKGGYEVEHAYRYYGTLMVASDCEVLIKEATLDLLHQLRP